MKKGTFLFIVLVLSVPAWAKSPDFFTTTDYVAALKQVTDVMVYDVTSPVAASRYYAYVTLAANEVYAAIDPSATSLKGRLNNFGGITTEVSAASKSNASVAALYALYKMAEKLLPSGRQLRPFLDSLAAVAEEKGLSKQVITQSILVANGAIEQLTKYIREDGFKNVSGYARYKPLAGDGYWQPTAPVFMQPVEPWWARLRPFLLDSCQQFKPALPTPFDTVHTCLFYQQLQEVYATNLNLTETQRAVAAFWDCNPFAVQQVGHVEFGLKRISPGGHWMGITGIACIKKKTLLSQSVFIHAVVAMAIADGFISCWDEKFRSNRVRPETAINRFVDPAWRPFLQTPPFPEYPSGHSVVSTAAATVLTYFFGHHFSFADSTEVEFDLPPRSFTSFEQAAAEAAISRLYGGIHFRDAIENGQVMGRAVGNWTLEKLDLSQKKAIARNNN